MNIQTSPDNVIASAQAWIDAANAQLAREIPDYPLVYWASKTVHRFPGEQLFDDPEDDPDYCRLKKINNSEELNDSHPR